MSGKDLTQEKRSLFLKQYRDRISSHLAFSCPYYCAQILRDSELNKSLNPTQTFLDVWKKNHALENQLEENTKRVLCALYIY